MKGRPNQRNRKIKKQNKTEKRRSVPLSWFAFYCHWALLSTRPIRPASVKLWITVLDRPL